MKKLVIFLLIAAPFVLYAQMTYVPDDNFEQALIDLGLDTPPLNDSIPTKNIDTLTFLSIPNKNISDLTGILDFKALRWFYCPSNKLMSLDVSNCHALENLGCEENLLISLNVTQNPNLKMLVCYNNRIVSLDLSNNPVLKTLVCYYNQLENLNVSKCDSLEGLYCFTNKISSLDIAHSNVLRWFDSRANPNLACIQVKDTISAKNNPDWFKDASARYSTDCGYTGVEDFKFENKDVSVTPNPASDFIEINNVIPAEAGILNQNVKIYNFLGEIVFDDSATPPGPLSRGGVTRIDVSGLVPGVYFVSVGAVVRKFVKIE